MPVIHKVQTKAKASGVRAKPKAVQGGIKALLKKLKFANTPKERAMYLKRLSIIQGQFKKSGKKTA